nr:MAG TPA: hypothetical protein [Caudoviricetes sp.]
MIVYNITYLTENKLYGGVCIKRKEEGGIYIFISPLQGNNS